MEWKLSARTAAAMVAILLVMLMPMCSCRETMKFDRVTEDNCYIVCFRGRCYKYCPGDPSQISLTCARNPGGSCEHEGVADALSFCTLGCSLRKCIGFGNDAEKVGKCLRHCSNDHCDHKIAEGPILCGEFQS